MEISKLQILIQAILLIALIAFAIFYFVSEKEAVANPIKVVTERYNINTCTCQTNSAETLIFNSTTITKQNNPWHT